MSTGPRPGAPQGPAEPGRPNVLGRRIVAALVDLIVLAVRFVVLASPFGQSSASGSSFSVSLHGGPAFLFFLLTLLYYFALEASIARTIGNLMLGLKVARADRQRALPEAIAVRTVLRIIDGLPVLYLVGRIAMLTTALGASASVSSPQAPWLKPASPA